MIFNAAAATVGGAIIMIALVDTWWALGIGFAIALVMTMSVTLAVERALDGRPLPPRTPA